MVLKLYISRTPDGVDLPLPRYASKHHIGLELFAAIPNVIKLDAGERLSVPIGFCVGIPEGYCGQIVSIPTVAKETGVIVLTAPQLLNPADRDAVFVLIHNSSNRQVILRRGQPIAQLVITPAQQVTWHELEAKTGAAHSSQKTEFLDYQPDQIPAGEEKQKSKRVIKSIRARGKAADETF